MLVRLCLVVLCVCGFLSAQQTSPERKPEEQSQTRQSATPSDQDSEIKQPKRILWIIPNYRAVSADTQLPPLSLKDKFKLATEDSFDYTSFILAGMLAGIAQARNSNPEFRQGGAGFGRYYWHAFADQALGNYLTEFIVPVATREDPRYYTLGHGGFFHRTVYSISRLLATRTDSGGRSFNFSEIVGNGAGAGISDLYYPAQERTWTKTGQKWVTQIALDGVFNIFKEFWPDISHGCLPAEITLDASKLFKPSTSICQPPAQHDQRQGGGDSPDQGQREICYKPKRDKDQPKHFALHGVVRFFQEFSAWPGPARRRPRGEVRREQRHSGSRV